MRKVFEVALAAVMGLGAANSVALGQEWTRIGFEGGSIARVVHAPSQPLTIYAIADWQGGVFRSRDGGSSWTSISRGLSYPAANAIAVHPTEPNTVYVATVLGVNKSVDGGATWSRANGVLPTNVADLAIDPTTPTTLFAAHVLGVYKTTDGGNSWMPCPAFASSISSVAIAPSAPATLYAAAQSGVYKSTNGGASWTAVNGGLTGAQVYAVTVDHTDANTVYATGDRVYKTTDGGVSWIAMSEGITTNSLGKVAIDRTNHNVLYVTMMGGAGVMKSTDAAAHWVAANGGLPAVPHQWVDVDPTDGTRLVLATGDGVFRTTDGASTWTPASTGLMASSVSAVRAGGGVPSRVFAAAEKGNDILFQLSRTLDGWTPIRQSGLDGESSEVLAVDPLDANVIYANGGCGSVVKTVDGGATWVRTETGLPRAGNTCAAAIVIDPDDRQTVYLAVWAYNEPALYRSTNGGASWQAASTGLPSSASALALVFTHAVPRKMYLATDDGVYKSTDSAATWTPASTGLPAGYGGGYAVVYALAISPQNDQLLLAGTEQGVYGTTDGGVSWQLRGDGWPLLGTYPEECDVLSFDPHRPGAVIASAITGTFVSMDNGASWHPGPSALEGVVVWDIQVTAAGTALVATGNGLFIQRKFEPSDFDGDGKTDVAVYRPSAGTWFWLKSATGNQQFGYRGWGVQAQGDVPVPGDYDGDGVTDPAVFRPATGTWFILESHADFTTWKWFGWGEATDTLVPGDYDGDGKTDAAVYRPSTGTWYIRPSNGSTPWNVVFGQAGDVPIAGDFDGDQKRDPAVYRPASGTWFWLKSSTNSTTYDYRGWGVQAQGDVPVPGDYDGDGETDLCVFRPASGTWFILESQGGWTTWNWFGWGNSTDTLVPADYDGDGKTDAAIYRASTGEWFVRPSSGATPWNVVFGQLGDVPVR